MRRAPALRAEGERRSRRDRAVRPAGRGARDACAHRRAPRVSERHRAAALQELARRRRAALRTRAARRGRAALRAVQVTQVVCAPARWALRFLVQIGDATGVAARRPFPVEMSEDLTELCRDIEARIARRRVIPFLGAGASLAGRPEGGDWQVLGFPPNGTELADLLAANYAYPSEERNRSLVRVAQYVDLKLGEQVLYDDLRETFTRPPTPTQVHCFLAERAASCRAAGEPNPWPMVITTRLRRCARAGVRRRRRAVRRRHVSRGARRAGRLPPSPAERPPESDRPTQHLPGTSRLSCGP